MPTKKLVGAAAFTAALTAGGVAGALFGTPVLSGAQESGTDTAPDNTAQAPEPGNVERRKAGPHADLSVAAEALGISADELRTQLESGKSIADVAAERNVDKQKVIDALVAAATARIDEMKAQLPEHMANFVERDGLPRHGKRGPGGPGGRHHPGHPGAFNAIDDAATALGISRLELREAFAAGKSIAQVAQEKGVSLDDVKAAMIRDASARIDQAVENGRLTAEKAAEMKAALATKIDQVVNRTDWDKRPPAPEGDAQSTASA